MNCHMCGERRATIHLLELIDGRQKSVWLCSICASGRPDIPRLDPADGIKAGESPTLASFLGQSYAGDQQAVAAPPCPECGYRIAAFQERNRLGCPGCYPHFRRQIAPIVARFHRHASHVGRVPRRAGGHATRQGEMTRVRVALEKAIRAEDYEEAARLRDTLRRQTAEADAEGREPGGSRGA
jgi:protein arginine kinase activator